MSRHSRPNTPLRIALAVISVLLIVVLMAVTLIYRPSWLHADTPTVERSSVGRTVSPRQRQTYCPSRMTIADTDAYGDSEYQASNGNIASSARYAAFGSVFHSSVASMGTDMTASVSMLDKKDDSSDDIFVASGNVDDGSRLQDTRLLTASNGTGAVSSVMSWATDGDLKGVSAASCVVPALKQAFLLSGTKTGLTQQLVVANPSAKDTSVTIRIWGSDKSGALALSTGSTLTVASGKETVLNLSAAASGQDALYATVTGTDTPVAAIVRTVSMDGLTPKGSDYALPNNAFAKSLALYGLNGGDHATLYLYTSRKTDVTVSWIDSKGAQQTNQQELKANRASAIDLGDVPKSATGIAIAASEPVSATAKISDDGPDGQSDFALVNASAPAKISAIAVPDQSTATVGFVNTADGDRTAIMTAYGTDGKQVDRREIAIRPSASTSVRIADINDGDVAAIRLKDPAQAVVWNLRVGQKDVSGAKLAGLAIIGAVGGGSAMDAGKIMWMMYEHPEANFEDMAMDFMDIRKRIFTFPEMGKKAYFVAVPTSSGTGSECTPFAIITDKETGIKWPLADYALLPNMAIVDADNCMTAPRGLTAASGIDVMTHAIESYVSIMASDYTKGLSERAAKLVFENLPSSFTNGAKDPHAREEMHNASCMAGMAFANAFLGLNHSMAHKLGAFHHLPHGIANAVILTRVMRYNAAEAPVKMGTFSQYPYPNALHNYAEMAKYCGIEGKDDKEVFENFITKLEELKDFIGVKKTIADYGVDEQYFLDTLDEMTEQAFNDQCTGANPRYPLMSEIKELYLDAYYGREPQDYAVC